MDTCRPVGAVTVSAVVRFVPAIVNVAGAEGVPAAVVRALVSVAGETTIAGVAATT